MDPRDQYQRPYQGPNQLPTPQTPYPPNPYQQILDTKIPMPKQKSGKTGLVVILLVIMAATTAGAWYFQQLKINDLNSTVTDLQKQLSDAKAKPSANTTATDQNSAQFLQEIQTKNQDSERTTDIKALHGQLEAYYVMNGRYPALTNLNDTAWLASNMKGLDVEALKDPVGKHQQIVATPTAQYYAYAAKASDNTNCDNVAKDCVAYTLTTLLNDGSSYTKNNLN